MTCSCASTRSKDGDASQREAVQFYAGRADRFARHYDEFALDASKSFFTYHRFHVARILNASLAPPPGKLLDIGCGTGHILAQLSRQGYTPFGCDGSKAMLDVAADSQELTSLARAYVTDLPFVDGVFDNVISIEVLRYLPPSLSGEVLKEVFRVLRPGGMALISYSPAWNTRLYRGLLRAASLGRLRRPKLAESHSHTAGTLTKIFRECGFKNVRVEARMFGPFALIHRLMPRQFARIVAWWEPHDERLAQLGVMRNLASLFVVVAQKPPEAR